MTKQEFTERVKVEVNDREFDLIHEFYMSCECDKDEFCKMWVKMNKNRVNAARVDRMVKAKDEACRNTLRKFYDKTFGSDYSLPVCYSRISVYEVQQLSYAGIKVKDEYGIGLKNIGDIRHEIREYLGMN